MQSHDEWRRQQQTAWTYFQGIPSLGEARNIFEQLWQIPTAQTHANSARILTVCFAELLFLDLFARSKSEKRVMGAIIWLIDRIYMGRNTNLVVLSDALSDQPDLQRVFVNSRSALWVEATTKLVNHESHSFETGESFSRSSISRGRDDLYEIISENLSRLYAERYTQQFILPSAIEPIGIPSLYQSSPIIRNEVDVSALLMQLPTRRIVDENHVQDLPFANHQYIQRLSSSSLTLLVSRAIRMGISVDDLKRIMHPISDEMNASLTQKYREILYKHGELESEYIWDLETLCIEIIDLNLSKKIGFNMGHISCQLCLVFGIESDGSIVPLMFQTFEDPSNWTDLATLFDAQYLSPDTIICEIFRPKRKSLLRFLADVNLVPNHIIFWDFNKLYSNVSTNTRAILVDDTIQSIPAISDERFKQIFPFRDQIKKEGDWTEHKINLLRKTWYEKLKS
ncbi:MAG: hypothetical protein AAFR81_27120 [Chloroflexota bacterium]